MEIQAELRLKRVEGAGPLHLIAIEDIGASSKGLDPAAFFVFRKEVMAEALRVQVGRSSGRPSWPLTDEAVYF
jgi:hypothetical protein